ncbi:hypothetical protein HP550_10010 [Cellulomonas humilata]|uniref:Uncharacterized protein n=1 Tax=Cellulomonas humilata TaxID=144055 RepID=A0A7Y6A0V2_9CELL|nr:hypothetical protein [Cellulomonas humilata]
MIAAGSSVNDVATALLTRLHPELAAGGTPAEALHAAAGVGPRTSFAVHGAGWGGARAGPRSLPRADAGIDTCRYRRPSM